MEVDLSIEPAPPAQGDLFDAEDLGLGRELLLPPEEQAKRYTGEHVARNQERYRQIVAAIAEGIGVRAICRAFSVSHHTVQVIREREAALVATEKERIARGFGRLQWCLLERLTEAVEKDLLPVAQMGVVLGIVSDKKAALESGGVTQRIVVEHVNQESVRAKFASLIDVEATTVADHGMQTPTVADPESKSGVLAQIPEQIRVDCAPVSDFDADLPTEPPPTPAGQTRTATTAPSEDPTQREGGGGSENPGLPPGMDGNGSGKFEA